MDLQRLREKIHDSIDLAIKNDEYDAQASWREQYGVLLSYKEADLLLNVIEEKALFMTGVVRCKVLSMSNTSLDVLRDGSVEWTIRGGTGREYTQKGDLYRVFNKSALILLENDSPFDVVLEPYSLLLLQRLFPDRYDDSTPDL